MAASSLAGKGMRGKFTRVQPEPGPEQTVCEHEGLEPSLLPAALMKSAFEMGRSGTSQTAHPALCAMSLKKEKNKKQKNPTTKNPTLLIYFVSCSFGYLVHSKEREETRRMTFCKINGDSLQE